ncbi:hypothetical protein EV137_0737 [Kribbella pratensis]|uniref:Uncharacterized protein n=1 Tax=Kribbella pratensis TaxID=2512112 RepID=A0ABY2FK06_9ACTN|nr:hypothetical protein [Kribbella pratensis]TDW93455.1 hypothetical protein EV137_0737 [Kribbella pratensis]
MTNKVLRAALGVTMLVIGGCLAVSGAILSAVAGPDDTMRTGYHPVTAGSRALVARAANISPGAVPHGFGDFTLRINVRSADKPVFIGVAPDAAAESYLSGAAVRTVRGLELWPYKLHAADTQGTATPPPPGNESFWVASADGGSPQLTWNVTNGNYRVVIMNHDASPGLTTEVRYALTIPWLFEIGIGSLALGGVIGIPGLVLLVGTVRGHRSQISV